MNHKVELCFAFIILMLVISEIALAVQAGECRKNLSSLQLSMEEFKENNKSLLERFDERMSSFHEYLGENERELKNELSSVSKKMDAQFSKTVSMSRTYDSILEEQKKKTIDTAEKDHALIDAKKEALTLYKKGCFADAYGEFSKLLAADDGDMESRLYKTKSLFYMNRADSSSFALILEDIKILRQNAALDDECIEIEKSILAEREGLDE